MRTSCVDMQCCKTFKANELFVFLDQCRRAYLMENIIEHCGLDYDFDYQEMRMLPELRTLKPVGGLMYECRIILKHLFVLGLWSI